MTNLLEKQDKLQKQALAIIEELGLKNVLSKYGQCNVVGSAAYGLMTWRDIDVDVVFNNNPTDHEYWEIVQYLFSLPNTNQLTLIDNRQGGEANRPKSMYIGAQHKDNKHAIWKIDIRLLAKEFVMTDRIAQLIKETMSAESRNTILQIKSQVHDNPKYHKDFSSVDIYEAVLSADIKDLNGFKEYLLEHGKSF